MNFKEPWLEVIGDIEELFCGRGGEPCLIERVNKKL